MKEILVLLTLLSTLNHIQSASLHSRIVKGEQSESASEYAVEINSITNDKNLQTWGGGTLIAPNVVLTSAQLIVGYSLHYVRFGSFFWSDLYVVNVTEAVAHPNYDGESHLHDIGFMRLEQSVDQSEWRNLLWI